MAFLGAQRDQKISIDDPMMSKGQFREDAWSLMQKRKRGGKDGGGGGWLRDDALAVAPGRGRR